MNDGKALPLLLGKQTDAAVALPFAVAVQDALLPFHAGISDRLVERRCNGRVNLRRPA